MMRAVVAILKKHVEMLTGSKNGKQAWVDEAVPVLIDVNAELKVVTGTKMEAQATLKKRVKELLDSEQVAVNNASSELKVLDAIDDALRVRLLEEYKGVEPIAIDGMGEVSFRQPWVYTVTDAKKVPAAYLAVSDSLVKAAIEGGIRAIPGIKIEQGRVTVVKTSKE